MQVRIIVQRLALVFALLFFTGCDQKALLQRITPKDDDAFARRFIDAIRAGDQAAAKSMLDSSVQGEGMTTGLRSLHDLLAQDKPLSTEIVGCNVLNMREDRRTNLSYQIHFPHAWVAGNVLVETKGHDASRVLGSQFTGIPESLEVVNRFSLSGKSPIHFAVLAACVAIPAFILYALIVCIRTRLRRKWLWIIFILFGLTQVRFDWTSGAYEIRPIAILLFGGSATKAGPYAPWVLGFGLPVGAIIFLLRRRQLISPDAPEEPEMGSADGPVCPPPLP